MAHPVWPHVDPEVALETDRLLLEPLRTTHAPELFDALRDRQLYRYLEESPPTCPEALAKRFGQLEERTSPDGREAWLNWACRDREGGELVGLVQATLEPTGRAWLAYVFVQPGQGRGLAREACGRVVEHLFRDYGVEAILAEVHPANARSLALIRTLGFWPVEATNPDVTDLVFEMRRVSVPS